jgi:hypothetical protein
MRDSIVDAILELDEGDAIEIPFSTKELADSLRTGLYRRFQQLPDNMKDDIHIGRTAMPDGTYKLRIWRENILSKMLLVKSTGEVLPVITEDTDGFLED